MSRKPKAMYILVRPVVISFQLGNNILMSVLYIGRPKQYRLKAASVAFVLLTTGVFSLAEVSGQPSKKTIDVQLTQFTDLEGVERNLSEYQGQVLLVNFWTSWCPPCIREMPAIEFISRHMVDRPLQVIMVNVNEPPGILQRFTRLADAGIVVLRDPDGGAARAWGVTSYPTTYFFDTAGKVRDKILGAVDWDNPEWVSRLEVLISEENVGTPEN